MYIIHEYNHIASSTSLTNLWKNTHFIGDPLNFPGTHWNDHLWVPGTRYIEYLFTSLYCIIRFCSYLKTCNQPLSSFPMGTPYGNFPPRWLSLEGLWRFCGCVLFQLDLSRGWWGRSEVVLYIGTHGMRAMKLLDKNFVVKLIDSEWTVIDIFPLLTWASISPECRCNCTLCAPTNPSPAKNKPQT